MAVFWHFQFLPRTRPRPRRLLGPPFCRLGIGRCARQRFQVFALNVPINSFPPVYAAEPKLNIEFGPGDRPVGLVYVGAHIDFFAAHGCMTCAAKTSHCSVTATRSLGSSIFAIHSRSSRREKFAGQLSSGKCRSRRPRRVDKYSASNSAGFSRGSDVEVAGVSIRTVAADECGVESVELICPKRGSYGGTCTFPGHDLNHVRQLGRSCRED